MATTNFEASGKPRRAVPLWLLLAAGSVPAGILGQYLLAGLALFYDGLFWAWHGGLGTLLFLPIVAMAVPAWFGSLVRPLRWWTGLLVLLYGLQMVLMVSGQALGSGLLQALHPFNGGLMLVASLVIAAKVARSRVREAL